MKEKRGDLELSLLEKTTKKDILERTQAFRWGDCCLNERMRGIIEDALDKVEATEIVDSIKWIEQEIPIKSLKDLAIGYVVGSSLTGATTMIAVGEQHLPTEEEKLQIREIMKRRLPAFIKKIERELNR